MRTTYLVCYDITDDKRLRRAEAQDRGGDRQRCGEEGMCVRGVWELD